MHLCRRLSLNKVADPRPDGCNFILKETPTQVISRKFFEICQNAFFYKYLRTTSSGPKGTNLCSNEFLLTR